MVGDVADAGEFRDALHQGLLDAFLEGQVHRCAALATAAEGQHRHLVLGQLHQLDLTAVGRQTRVDLAVEDVVDAILERAIGVDLGHLGVGRLDGQLAAHAVGVEVDHRLFQERNAVGVEIDGDLGKLQALVTGLFLARPAVRQTGLGVGRARLGDEDPHRDTFDVLLLKQLRQVVLCAVGDLDILAHGSLASSPRLTAGAVAPRVWSGPW